MPSKSVMPVEMALILLLRFESLVGFSGQAGAHGRAQA
jgi:hypothetical protein